MPIKTCTLCHVEKNATPDRKSDFTIQSQNPRTQIVYYASRCKTCCSSVNKTKYVKVSEKKKPGKSSIVERDDSLKQQIEQMMFDGIPIAQIARTLNLPTHTLYNQKKRGFITAVNHVGEVEEESD